MQDQIQLFANKNKISRDELKNQIWKKFQQLLSDNDTANMDAIVSLGLIDSVTLGEKLVEMFSNLCSRPNCPKNSVPAESRIHFVVTEEQRNPSQSHHIHQAMLLFKYMKKRQLELSVEHLDFLKKRQEAFLENGCLDFFKDSMLIFSPTDSVVQKIYRSYWERNWDDGIRLVHSMTGIKPNELAIGELSSIEDEMKGNSLSAKIKHRLQETFRTSKKKGINPDQQMNVVCNEVVKFLYA
ncbi:MAG: hypothetical protein HQL70_02040 [Magnetococcales bacterium]|nr:hypothetical protein [Magnetococcales bacterium]